MKKALIILLSILQVHAMGMDYYISANIETDCSDNFPSGLSFFFEQVGGYGEKSMVSQVEQILDIDLSTFQKCDFMENEESDSTYWKDINEFESLIDLFLNKIDSSPQYYKEVKFHPMYGYPNDHGYLSEGRIVDELKELKSLLTCYRKAGATKIKLNYD